MGVSVLDREMFTEAAAARLLKVPQATLNYWLEGGTCRGRQYKPVVREQPRGSRASVTWAEFVEAGLIREYRRTHRIPMAELRAFIDQMRQKLGVPYPLAHQRPYASGKDLLAQAQDVAGLDADLCLRIINGGAHRPGARGGPGAPGARGAPGGSSQPEAPGAGITAMFHRCR